ncbi:MAG: AraC family transcriptional regulator [Tardiphaga sp.]
MYEISPSAPADDASGPYPHGGRTDSLAALGLQMFRPRLVLRDIVEDIWDWDLPDASAARRLTVRLPPSTYAFLLIQYRAPLVADWAFGAQRGAHTLRRHIAVKMQTGVTTIRPTGAIGTVIVRFRPEATDRITPVPLSRFIDHKLNLRSVFCSRAVQRLEQLLTRAPDAVARIGVMQGFLLQNMRPAKPCKILARAAMALRRNPSTSISELAHRLDISVRHLSRGFKAAFGTGPKQFARLVRVEKAMAARRDGAGWTEIAHACGFADQAHLIHDFRAIVGAAPEEIFRPPTVRPFRDADAPHVRVFFNLFIG